MLLSEKISRKLWLIAVVISTIIGSPVKSFAYKGEGFKTVDNLSSVTLPTSESPLPKTSLNTPTNFQESLITQNIIPTEVPNPIIMPRNEEQLNPQPPIPTKDDLLENSESAPSNSPYDSESNFQSEPENSQSDSEFNSQSELENSQSDSESKSAIYLENLQIEFEGNTAFTDEELCNWIVNSSEQNKDDENKKNEGNDNFWKRIIDEESDKELCKLAPKDSEQKITFDKLLDLERIITKKYTEGCEGENLNNDKPCYQNSGAVISVSAEENQTINQNEPIIKINIMEGEIGEIKITGTKRLKSGYIRSRLEIATQKPFDTKRLLQALQKLQINPLIQNISAELSAGARPQSNLLSVNITEASTFNLSLLTDNRRVPSVGSWRRGFLLNEANLFGFGDSVFLNYYNTDGSNAVDLNYTIPFNPHNGTIGITTRFNQTEIIEPPFDRLDITGNSRSYELNVRQPIYHSIYQSISEDFALGLTLSRQESKTELLGKGFPLSRGANEDGDTRISTIRFSQDWTKITPTEVWALRSQFNVGFSALDATHNDFFSWRGQGQYVKVFPSSTSFLIRSNIQLGTELPALEQLGIGGLDSVRGYRQDILLTDNGLFINAELRYPVWQDREIETVLQIVPFIDFGYGWNSSDVTVLDTNTLIGVGVGLRFTMRDRLNARFDWAIPLTNIGLEKNTWQENGLYFSVEWQLLK